MAALAEQGGSGAPIDLQELADNVILRLPSYARPAFLRLVPELDITGTYKLKKRAMQLEGYDPSIIKDKMFFLDIKKKEYVPLTPELFDDINQKRVRI